MTSPIPTATTTSSRSTTRCAAAAPLPPCAACASPRYSSTATATNTSPTSPPWPATSTPAPRSSSSKTPTTASPGGRGKWGRWSAPGCCRRCERLHSSPLPYHPPGPRARMLAVAENQRAVDEDVHDAGGVLHRLLVGRAGADGLRIEDDDVGERAGRERAASGDPEVLGGEGSEAADGLGQRDDRFGAHVLAQQVGEVPVGARVRARLEEHALGRGGLGIRAERDPRLPDLPAQVVLGHQEIDRADARAVLDDQIDRRVLGRDAARARHLRERLAGERLELLVLEADQQHVLRAAGEH